MKSASQARCGPGRPRDEALRLSRTDEILDAAAGVFAQHGYQHTEMQTIADELQVGKGTIYRYFTNKEDLFSKTVWRGMDRLRQAVNASGEGVTDPIEQITKAIYAYLAFFREHPEYVELLIQERAKFRDTKNTYFEHREKYVSQWLTFYDDLIAIGRIRNVPASRIIDVTSSLLYGTMFTNHYTGRHKPLEAQARDLVDVLFCGILSESERGSWLKGDKPLNGCVAAQGPSNGACEKGSGHDAK
jgi:AcrR family transcriptional regulator